MALGFNLYSMLQVTTHWTICHFEISKLVGNLEFKYSSESQVLIWGMYGKENVWLIIL